MHSEITRDANRNITGTPLSTKEKRDIDFDLYPF